MNRLQSPNWTERDSQYQRIERATAVQPSLTLANLDAAIATIRKEGRDPYYRGLVFVQPKARLLPQSFRFDFKEVIAESLVNLDAGGEIVPEYW